MMTKPNQQNGFCRIPWDVVDRLRPVGSTGVHVYLVLVRYAGAAGKCFPSVPKLAAKCGLSESTVRRALRKLEEHGFIATDQSSGRTASTYCINPVKNDRVTQSNLTGLRGRNPVKNDTPTQSNLTGEVDKGSRSSRRSFSSADLATAETILNLILELQPSRKKPNLERWADDVRLMRERDGRTHDEIFGLFQWCNQDSFWCTNILSPSKLREKWDDLELRRTKSISRHANVRDDGIIVDHDAMAQLARSAVAK